MGRNRIVSLANLDQFTAINVLSDPGNAGGPVVVPNCAQITVGFGLESGKVGHLVWYGRYAGGFSGSQTQANAILTGLAAGGPWTTLAGFLATSTVLGNVSIRDVNTANQPIVTSSVAGVAGTSASPSLPNEVALVVTLRTGQTGRAFRGRSFVPGWATNALGAGNVAAAAAVTALQNWSNVWTGVLSGQGYTFVIGQKERIAYKGSTGTQHDARAATSVQITSTVVRDNHWDSQRRRGLK